MRAMAKEDEILIELRKMNEAVAAIPPRLDKIGELLVRDER